MPQLLHRSLYRSCLDLLRRSAHLRACVLVAFFSVHTWGASQASTPPHYVPSSLRPPDPVREFRGAWVATVNNIDWPSRPGLSTSQQQQELTGLLDRAAAARLNAIFFQVRPACDAFYESRIEPWSEYLSGQMGVPPSPPYDPLAFVIQEAHRRGMELHAWFNPFRARHHSQLGPASPRHVTIAKQQWTRAYGRYQWLDPSDPAVQDYSLQVILDVVRRYNIDGVHMDDYFYPYPEKDAKGRPVDFPDSHQWKRYLSRGGRLSRDDWRRSHVDNFVQNLSRAVRSQKPWLRVGISPFGIWRPGHPAGVEGLDAYDELFADARKWWREGWLDYLTPQLYWPIDSPKQSFPSLLHWWAKENVRGRHLWPGLNTANIGTKYQPLEILRQIQLSRTPGHASGQVHWSIKPLLEDRQEIAQQLIKGPYAAKALTPACPWNDPHPPGVPVLKVRKNREQQPRLVFQWSAPSGEVVGRWVLQFLSGDQWMMMLYPENVRSLGFSGETPPQAVSVRAMDRSGNLSAAAVLQMAN
ncbi:MAG: hypothetical protein FJ405_04105 [Verrucomicrobia bacterium]|nr:hypothetical protein [Verrucomicrobiota bacterium]